MVFNIAQFSKSSHGKVQAGQANRSILNWCLGLCKEIVVQIIFAKSIYMFYTWLCSSVLITFTPCTAPFSTCQSQLANLVVYLKIWFLLFIHNDGEDSMSMLGLISSKMHKNPEDLDVASNLGVTQIWIRILKIYRLSGSSGFPPGKLPSTERVDGGLKIGLSWRWYMCIDI